MKNPLNFIYFKFHLMNPFIYEKINNSAFKLIKVLI